jgi:transcriptional regulator with XRE-family HTH domain
MYPYQDISLRFHLTREKLGYSQSELAKLAGVSQKTISRYERGTVKRPDYGNVVAIARVLKVKL